MEEMKRDLGTTCRLEANVLVDLQFCRVSKLACESESKGGTDSRWILNGVRRQCVAMGFTAASYAAAIRRAALESAGERC
ncbi:hypothetical protein E2562_022433 [Oryza meyeriana var. granulata]|uniref:Uncharacterized protein n=1 Tax=Oryza meyeriana var. granulata TaxID=110450 RepID=A0A6G1BMU3_9ORYZ|nr:hypothetical protein E2562_022433 [Oryza meyeriana var. granulata]